MAMLETGKDRIRLKEILHSPVDALLAHYRKRKEQKTNKKKPTKAKVKLISPTHPWKLSGLLPEEEAMIKSILGPTWGELEMEKNRILTMLHNTDSIPTKMDWALMKEFYSIKFSKFINHQWVMKERVATAIKKRVKVLDPEGSNNVEKAQNSLNDIRDPKRQWNFNLDPVHAIIFPEYLFDKSSGASSAYALGMLLKRKELPKLCDSILVMASSEAPRSDFTVQVK